MNPQLLFLIAVAFAIHRAQGAFWSAAGGGAPSAPAPLPPCGTGPVLLDPTLNTTIDAALGQVSWQVSVMTKKMGATWAHACGGALVAKQAVLTSASCVDGMNAGFVRIEGAIIDLPKGGFVRRRRAIPNANKYPGQLTPGLSYIEKIVKHPDYNKATGENNLVVLRLATAPDFTKAAGALNLVCDPAQPLAAGDPGTLFISGWGNLQPKGSQLRGKLQLKTIEQVECPVWRNDNEFCAAQEGECEGDIGGPVFGANPSQLIAIQSRGAGCSKESPMLYTEVYPYLDWIKDAAKPYY